MFRGGSPRKRSTSVSPRPALYGQFEAVRAAAQRAISPLKPADKESAADRDFLIKAARTEAGRSLPPYYFVYFLLVELLRFRNLGRWEKTAWSVPVDLDGEVYLIEHRKFGIGVFVKKPDESEQQAQRIVALIKKGVKAATPFFRWKAERAIQESQINVSNVAGALFDRYSYFVRASTMLKLKRASASKTMKPARNNANSISRFP